MSTPKTPLEKSMDLAYARLSAYCGYFAMAADSALNSNYFQETIREQRWSLTPEKLAEWKNEAVRRGVPAHLLDPPNPKAIDAIVKIGIKLQNRIDKGLSNPRTISVKL